MSKVVEGSEDYIRKSPQFEIIDEDEMRKGMEKSSYGIQSTSIVSARTSDTLQQSLNSSEENLLHESKQLKYELDKKEALVKENKTDSKPQIAPPSYSLLLKLFSCLLYAVSSSGLTFINKSIYVRFGFKSPLDVSLHKLSVSKFSIATLDSMPLQRHHLLLHDAV